MPKLLLPLTLLSCLLQAGSPTRQPASDDGRVAGWRSDLDVWLRALSTQHYVFRDKMLPESLRVATGNWRESVVSWSDERALAELMRLAAMAGGRRTYGLPFCAPRVASPVLPPWVFAFHARVFLVRVRGGC